MSRPTHARGSGKNASGDERLFRCRRRRARVLIAPPIRRRSNDAELERKPALESTSSSALAHDSGGIDDARLEAMAQRLLDNSNINVWLVPDFIERQVCQV